MSVPSLEAPHYAVIPYIDRMFRKCLTLPIPPNSNDGLGRELASCDFGNDRDRSIRSVIEQFHPLKSSWTRLQPVTRAADDHFSGFQTCQLNRPQKWASTFWPRRRETFERPKSQASFRISPKTL